MPQLDPTETKHQRLSYKQLPNVLLLVGSENEHITHQLLAFQHPCTYNNSMQLIKGLGM
jgi:hypothetical protein